MRLPEAHGAVVGSTVDSGPRALELQGHSPALSALRPGLPKAVVSLQPPWLQVFPEDNVTLSCQGARSPGDSSTQWFHNGTAIPTQTQPSYSFKASSSHSGDYRCQTGQTGLSDPVHLDVTSGQWRSGEPGRRAWERPAGRGFGKGVAELLEVVSAQSFPPAPPSLLLCGCLGMCEGAWPQS